MKGLSIGQMAKLAKVATGNLRLEEAITLLEGFGCEVSFSDTPADRKADVFQRVAQFSLQPGTELKHMTLIGPDGLRLEALAVMRGTNESNIGKNQKVVDDKATLALTSSQST